MSSADVALPRKRVKTDFRYGKVLGEGSYATVLYAEEPATSLRLAIKVVSKRHVLRHGAARYVAVERDVLHAACRIPFVVRLYYTFQDPDSLFFALEYCPNADLLQHISLHGSLELAPLRSLLAETIIAIRELHTLGIIHRDLKPENILLDANFHVRITDFGSAKITSQNAPQQQQQQKQQQQQQQGDQRKNSFVGTAEYCSPELLVAKTTSPASDIWAIGAIAFHMLFGRPPFQGANDYLIFQKIMKLDFQYPTPDQFTMSPDPNLNQSLIDTSYTKYVTNPIVAACLVLDPQQRPTAEDLLALPIFTQDNIHYQRISRETETNETRGTSTSVEQVVLNAIPKSITQLASQDVPAFGPGIMVNKSIKRPHVGGLEGLRGPPPLMFDAELLLDPSDAF